MSDVSGMYRVACHPRQEMSVTIKPDPQHTHGIYVVHWITKSALDGDPDEGAFTFTVSALAATATPTASNTSTSGGTPIWVTALLALVVLVIGLGGGFSLGRHRPAPSSGSPGAMRRAIEEEQQERTKRP